MVYNKNNKIVLTFFPNNQKQICLYKCGDGLT